MTTQEIKDLVAAKIAGQGSMVDAGGALPTILNAIVDAIDAITPGEILSFAEPLKKSGTDVSLQIGGGLEKDSDDALAVKLAENGGLITDANGAGLSPRLLQVIDLDNLDLDETEYENLTEVAILAYLYQGKYQYCPKIDGKNWIDTIVNNLPDGYTLNVIRGVWISYISYNLDGSVDGANLIVLCTARDANHQDHYLQRVIDI